MWLSRVHYYSVRFCFYISMQFSVSGMFDCGGLTGIEQLFTTQLSQEQSPRLRDIRSVFPDQIAFSSTEMFQIKKAFRHSVQTLYMPLYVLHGERRHTEVMELFSNWPDTALFRALHKQPDFQRCSTLIVWRAWNSSTSFKTASYQASLKHTGAETLGGGEGGFCHTTSVLTCWGNEFF